MREEALREQLARVLDWSDAHAGFDKAVDGIPATSVSGLPPAEHVKQLFAQHEIAVIEQPRTLLLEIWKHSVLLGPIREFQVIANQMTWSWIGRKEPIAVVQVHRIDVRVKDRCHTDGQLAPGRSGDERRDKRGQ